MWTYHNKKMKELKKIYQRTNLQTQNKIQDIFNSYKVEFDELFNIADIKTKKRINTYIEELKDKDLLNGEFGNVARNIYNRTRVKNSEILEFLIYSAYIEEQYKLEDKEMQIIKDDANYYYQEGQKEVNNTLKNKKILSIIPDAIFLSLLTMPNVKGYVYDDYKESVIKYNAGQIYRQAIIDIQQQKPLEIEADAYQGIIKKQQNQKLNITGDKISGDIDLTLIGINNKAKVEGITSVDKDAKVRFIAVGDERTTPMCESMDNMIFNVNDWNSFYRYSDYDKKDVFYKVKGLVTGVNLPPINNHFHWCRSSLTYIIDKEKYNQYKIDYEDVTLKIYKRINYKKKCNIVEQKDYIEKNGTIYNSKNSKLTFSPGKEEIKIASKFKDTFYQNVILLPKVDIPQRISTADYLINDKFVDLKTINKSKIKVKKNAIYNSLKNSQEQGNNFIIDVTNYKKYAGYTDIDVNEQISSIFNSKYRNWVEMIYIYDNERFTKIYKRKR